MNALPTTPGPHRVDFAEHAHELFEIEKEVMAASPYLYQFGSFEEFTRCFTVEHTSSVYVWNSEEGETIGFFIHSGVLNEEHTDELTVIVILPRFQGQGYGKQMMEFYFELTKDKAKRILTTHEKNEGAIRFYQSLGYKLTKEIPNQYGDGQTRVLLEKRP